MRRDVASGLEISMYRKHNRKSFNLLKAVLNKRFRLAISETLQNKMADTKIAAAAAGGEKATLLRANSEMGSGGGGGDPPKRAPLMHRKSWDGNSSVVGAGGAKDMPGSPRERAPVSPRGPMKSHVSLQKPDDTLPEEAEENHIVSPRTSPRGNANNKQQEVEIPEGFPDPDAQRAIVTGIDTECTCTYAVSKIWYRKWEEFVGVAKGHAAGEAESPGVVEMDAHNDGNNEYLNEEVWKRLIKWYGISRNHQLDRKHLYFKDEKMFDVCTLSPFSGIVEHQVKKFNRFEEIGYIECQLRRIFQVEDHKKSRLWISEKAQVPRFRQLLLRFRMLNDCIHRDKVYILALEECSGANIWPTGEPGEPKGDLTKYNDILCGPRHDGYWAEQVTTAMEALTTAVTETLQQTTKAFLQEGQMLVEEKESELEQVRKIYENKLESTKAKENFLGEKSKELNSQEDRLHSERDALEKDFSEFRTREETFNAEQARIKDMHKLKQKKIKLDVGGTMFTTTMQSIKRDPNSLLAGMFSGRHELEQEADGSYFIDRDGTFFRFILNFLREGYLEQGTLPSDSNVLREILREARHYQIAELVSFLEEQLQRSPSAQSSCSAKSF